MNSQFGSMVFDYLRKFNLEVEVEGKKESKEFYRRYNLMIPMGTNFEEVYEVLAEMSADVKKMEEDKKKMEEDNKKAIAEKEAKVSSEEKSVA